MKTLFAVYVIAYTIIHPVQAIKCLAAGESLYEFDSYETNSGTIFRCGLHGHRDQIALNISTFGKVDYLR
jgi:hypothetical protein